MGSSNSIELGPSNSLPNAHYKESANEGKATDEGTKNEIVQKMPKIIRSDLMHEDLAVANANISEGGSKQVNPTNTASPHLQIVNEISKKNESNPSSTKTAPMPLNAAQLALSKRRGRTNSSGSRVSISSQQNSRGSSFKSLDSVFSHEKATNIVQMDSPGISVIYTDAPITVNSTVTRRKHEIDQEDLKFPWKCPQQNLTLLDVDEQNDQNLTKCRKQKLSKYRMKKFNSTSTLFVDSVFLNLDFLEYLKQ
jgi:hypothetical protein